MKLNSTHTNTPTILPWHWEAAKEVFPNDASTAAAEDWKLLPAINACIDEKQKQVAAIIARHDPHAAKDTVSGIGVHTSGEWDMAETISRMQEQHAETLRLLEAICGTIEAHEIESLDCDRSGNDYCDCLRKIIAKARAHLAAHGGGK